MALSIDQKRLKATKFPPEFDRKVDIEKVNIDLMKKWIAQKITDILGDEDDIVVETCYNLIEQNQFVRTATRLATKHSLTCQQPKIKEIQIQLTGFLNTDILQRAMGPDAERSGQPYGRTKGDARGEEA
jgi:serine/arginine repetitive matrix protein 1